MAISVHLLAYLYQPSNGIDKYVLLGTAILGALVYLNDSSTPCVNESTATANRDVLAVGVWLCEQKCFQLRSKYGSTIRPSERAPLLGVMRALRS